MAKITFIEHDGERRTVDVANGQTLMEAATQNGIRGIIGECGGARVCGTCHCYIHEAWLSVTGGPCEDEKMLMEFSENHRPNSRLSCQVQVSDAIDGLEVHLPSSQP